MGLPSNGFGVAAPIGPGAFLAGKAVVQYIPPPLWLALALCLPPPVVMSGQSGWRQGPIADALLLGRIVVGTVAYLPLRSSAKHRLRLPEWLLRTDHAAFH
jgi:hypothetical protein